MELTEEQLIIKYKPLIRKYARKWWNYNKKYCEIDDLIQEGSLALLEANKNYDSSKSKFITHASNMIEWGILNYLKKFRNCDYQDIDLMEDNIKIENNDKVISSIIESNIYKYVKDNFDERRYKIFELRYKLGKTYLEISKIIGVSIERIRDIDSKIIMILREYIKI
jgi:RNA polymerase sigma factor (sigma-70 family)